MIIEKWRTYIHGGKVNTHYDTMYQCDCEDDAVFSFREDYDHYTGKVTCPFCGTEYVPDKDDRPDGFDAPEYCMDRDPFGDVGFRLMKGV